MKLRVNGLDYESDAAPSELLVHTLREKLHLTGTKQGCDEGSCGVCTVLVDGEPRLSCITLTGLVEGKEVTTIEGIGSSRSLHPVQKIMVENGALQCGFCTPGMVLSAVALLRKGRPSHSDIVEALSGNYCRCTGYQKIVQAIEMASLESGEP